MLSSIFGPGGRRRTIGTIACLATLGAGACRSLTDAVGDNRYGSIAVRASGSGEGPFTATPTATFFKSFEQTLPDSRTPTDQCGTFDYSPTTIVPGDLAPGGPLPVTVGSIPVGAMSELATVPGVFVLPSPNSFTYVTGDTMTLAVPGAAGGFPPGQVSVRLAEPVRIGALSPDDIGEDYPVSWETNGDGTSGIIIALRYGASSSSVRADRQLLCIVRDNGSFTITAGLMGEYQASLPDFRELNVLRWRTNSASIDARSVLYVVSSMDTTVALNN